MNTKQERPVAGRRDVGDSLRAIYGDGIPDKVVPVDYRELEIRTAILHTNIILPTELSENIEPTSAEASRISALLIERAMQLPGTVLLTASQFNINKRVAVMYSGREWITLVNLYLLDQQGEQIQKEIRSPVVAQRERVLLPWHQKVTANYFDLEGSEHTFQSTLRSVKPAEDDKSSVFDGNPEIFHTGVQFAAHVLDGRQLEVVPQNHRTIVGSERVAPNAPCNCGSGRKAKKCCWRG